MNTTRTGLLRIILALSVLTSGLQAAASDLRDAAWVSAQWALTEGKAQALADSLTLYLREGGTLAQDDPFSAASLLDGLRAMPEGEALAQSIIATQSRGQFGGAPRIDIVLAQEATHLAPLKLAADEITWIEARLWRGSDGADIDLELLDGEGNILAADIGETTGTEGSGALLQLHTDVCLKATLRVTNAGAGPGRVAILIPQSARSVCGDPG